MKTEQSFKSVDDYELWKYTRRYIPSWEDVVYPGRRPGKFRMNGFLRWLSRLRSARPESPPR